MLESRIFRNDTDRQNFLRRLETVAEEEGLVVLAYVLMDNHFHVVARRGACSACRPEHNRRPATLWPFKQLVADWNAGRVAD